MLNYVDAPVAGTAYKFVLHQASLGKHLGFTGAMDGFYYATSENIDEMVDVYLEAVTGGYRVYFLNNGVKTYLNIIVREKDNSKTDLVLQTLEENAAPSVYVLNTEFKYIKTTVNGVDWYPGTYNSFSTMSSSKTSYIEDTSKIGVSQFPAWFATVGKAETPDTPDTPVVPETPDYVTAPEAGKAYKLGLKQIAKDNVYYFIGTMSNFYGASDTDASKAVDMYLEAVTGGYHLYFNNGTAKQYVNIVASGTHINFTFAATATSVFVFDEEVDALYTTVNDAVYYMGTNDNYVTFGTIAQGNVAKENYYPARLYAIKSAAPETPETPDVETLTLTEANALAAQQEHNAYTEKEYKVTGRITEISNTQYGNCIISDKDGVTFGIYGIYKDGVRYDSLTVKPVVGDTITIQGSVGRYNENYQIKNGELIEHVPGTPSTPDQPETPPVNPEVPAGKYTKIETIADLKAGTYKMGAYLTASTGQYATDFSANPYHLWTGNIKTSSANTDLETTDYAFANGELTVKSGATDNAADITLVAVEGKANTYYIKVGGKYLYSTASATNRRLALGDTPTEWVAKDHSKGGVLFSSNNVFLGSADANSAHLRSYKSETTPKFGVFFFAEN